MKINYKRLIISMALPQLAGIVGSVFTTSAIPTWYATLQRPSFSPPNWIFGPVWITLYILMGISAYLIWQKVEENKQIIEAKPTLLFQALQELQNPPNQEDSANSKSISKGDLNAQAVGFKPVQKNFGNGIINPPVWGE